MNINTKLFSLAKALTEAELLSLASFAKSVEFKLHTDGEDRRRISEVEQLVLELPKLDKAEKLDERTADKKMGDAFASQELAEEALRAAKAYVQAARDELAAEPHRIRVRRFEIDRRLLEIAVPELGEYLFQLSDCWESVRFGFRWWVVNPGHRNWGATKEPDFASNVEDQKAAFAAIKGCEVQSLSMQRSPITRVDALQGLLAMNERLEKPLAALELNPPQLSINGEVGSPLRYAGYSCWSVSDITARQKRAAELAAIDAREAEASRALTAAAVHGTSPKASSSSRLQAAFHALKRLG